MLPGRLWMWPRDNMHRNVTWRDTECRGKTSCKWHTDPLPEFQLVISMCDYFVWTITVTIALCIARAFLNLRNVRLHCRHLFFIATCFDSLCRDSVKFNTQIPLRESFDPTTKLCSAIIVYSIWSFISLTSVLHIQAAMTTASILYPSPSGLGNKVKAC